jgi:hypothetical protein
MAASRVACARLAQLDDPLFVDSWVSAMLVSQRDGYSVDRRADQSGTAEVTARVQNIFLRHA